MNPSEFLDLMGSGDDKIKTSIRFGKVDAAHVSGKPKIVFDGMDAAGPKLYPYLSSYRPFANDRVMIVQGVVVGKIDNSGASPWQDIPITNGSIGIVETCQYMKDSMGFVHLRGRFNAGTLVSGTSYFTLPVGFRSNFFKVFPNIAHDGSVYFSLETAIDGSGNITSYGNRANTNIIPLNGISFLADQ